MEAVQKENWFTGAWSALLLVALIISLVVLHLIRYVFVVTYAVCVYLLWACLIAFPIALAGGVLYWVWSNWLGP